MTLKQEAPISSPRKKNLSPTLGRLPKGGIFVQRKIKKGGSPLLGKALLLTTP